MSIRPGISVQPGSSTIRTVAGSENAPTAAIRSPSSSSRPGLVRALVATAAGLAIAPLVGHAAMATENQPLRNARPELAEAPADDDVLQGAARRPGQLSPLITPAPAFYVVTKNAGGDPQ